ncbi:hypothetical protein [Tardiphaga sp. 862_B3_N1_1]|uniref:hypothetical protein n=1 Tax=Tardiphaga sp. 862_B3_N1_1 TaxID=3240763 RepID=UPI003F8ACB0A
MPAQLFAPGWVFLILGILILSGFVLAAFIGLSLPLHGSAAIQPRSDGIHEERQTQGAGHQSGGPTTAERIVSAVCLGIFWMTLVMSYKLSLMASLLALIGIVVVVVRLASKLVTRIWSL